MGVFSGILFFKSRLIKHAINALYFILFLCIGWKLSQLLYVVCVICIIFLTEEPPIVAEVCPSSNLKMFSKVDTVKLKKIYTRQNLTVNSTKIVYVYMDQSLLSEKDKIICLICFDHILMYVEFTAIITFFLPL